MAGAVCNCTGWNQQFCGLFFFILQVQMFYSVIMMAHVVLYNCNGVPFMMTDLHLFGALWMVPHMRSWLLWNGKLVADNTSHLIRQQSSGWNFLTWMFWWCFWRCVCCMEWYWQGQEAYLATCTGIFAKYYVKWQFWIIHAWMTWGTWNNLILISAQIS
jgi:hypothetical protein